MVAVLHLQLPNWGDWEIFHLPEVPAEFLRRKCYYPEGTVAVAGAVEQGLAGSLPRKGTLIGDVWGSLLGPAPRPGFWGADTNFTPSRALLLCISHPDGAVEAGNRGGQKHRQLQRAF